MSAAPPSTSLMPTAAALRSVPDEELFQLVSDNISWHEMELKTTPVHTAQRLRANDPKLYEQCRRLLACGVEITVISESMNVGVHTLYAIINAELGGQEEYNKGLAERFTRVVNLGVARMQKLIPEEKSLAAVAMATGVCADKAASLKGAPGLVVEHRVTVHAEAIDDLNAAVVEAQNALRRAHGKVVDVHDGAASADQPVPGCGVPAPALMIDAIEVEGGAE